MPSPNILTIRLKAEGVGHRAAIPAKRSQCWFCAQYSAPKGTLRKVEEIGMTLIVAIEASKPNGTVYRVALGWKFYPSASWFAAFVRLF